MIYIFICVFVLLYFTLRLLLVYLDVLDYLSGFIRSFYGKLYVSVCVVTGFMIGWWVRIQLYFGITTPTYHYTLGFFQGPLRFSKEYPNFWYTGSRELVFSENICISFSWFLTRASSSAPLIWFEFNFLKVLYLWPHMGKGETWSSSYI